MTAQTILQAAKTAQADIKLARQALKKAEVPDLQSELCENIYPLLEALARMGQRCAEEIDELGGVVAEIVEEEESFITPELSDQIGLALATGQALAGEVAKILPTVVDELLKKRLEDAAKSYQRAAEVAWQGVTEATGEAEDDDEEESEGDDEHEDLTEPPPAAARSAEDEEESHG